MATVLLSDCQRFLPDHTVKHALASGMASFSLSWLIADLPLNILGISFLYGACLSLVHSFATSFFSWMFDCKTMAQHARVNKAIFWIVASVHLGASLSNVEEVLWFASNPALKVVATLHALIIYVGCSRNIIKNFFARDETFHTNEAPVYALGIPV